PDDFWHAELFGEPRMRIEMPPLAMHRDGNLRLHPAIELLELAPARVPRHMHRRIALGDHLDAEIGKAVLHAPDRLLVAGDGAWGKYHAIAGFKFHIGMLVLRDPRHGGAGFALASGAERNDFPRRDLV